MLTASPTEAALCGFGWDAAPHPRPENLLVGASTHAEFVSRFHRRSAAAADQCATVSASKRVGNCNRTLRTVKNLRRLGNRFHLEVNVA